MVKEVQTNFFANKFCELRRFILKVQDKQIF